jgi:hypothetical protein
LVGCDAAAYRAMYGMCLDAEARFNHKDKYSFSYLFLLVLFTQFILDTKKMLAVSS